MSLVGHWEEAKFPAGINLVQTMAPGWRQIVSEVALDLITIPAVSALAIASKHRSDILFYTEMKRGKAFLVEIALQKLQKCGFKSNF